ncbi:MAG TPA: outer membrane protein assembly factor BamD [Pyrinomonadaceae bacterium]|nr:outer membrane protein assembly factor BamD [Pyrinomonadaceae bacterium]
MKKFLLGSLFALTMACGAAVAQEGEKTGSRREPDPSVLRDPVLEADSKKNLKVAQHYFKLKKAYRAAFMRAEEIIAGNPNFSQIDEAYYIAGMSHLRLSRKQGSQPPSLKPEQHREEARVLLSRLVNEYPDSEFRKEAEKELATVGGLIRTENQ